MGFVCSHVLMSCFHDPPSAKTSYLPLGQQALCLWTLSYSVQIVQASESDLLSILL